MDASSSLKVGGFVAALAVAFGAAFAVGGAVDPVTTPSTDADHAMAGTGDHEEAAMTTAAATLLGLSVSERGYTLTPEASTMRSGRATPFTFTVQGPDAQPVRRYTASHEKDLHLIVVRRDLTGFQHVHPQRDDAGRWTANLDTTKGGTYRVFADFVPTALGEGVVLGTDVAVGGAFEPTALPAPATTARVDDYTVTLDGVPTAASAAELTFTVRKDGRRVEDLEPYLGAFGHLVTLRAGDLAYLHTHPDQEASPGSTGGPDIRFAATFPTSGDYRLFVDFQHQGKVRTAEFTVDVGAPTHGRRTPAPGTAKPHDTDDHTH